MKKKIIDALMVKVARLVEEQSAENLSLKVLAEKFLLSPAHLQKRFKAAIGVSPKEYQAACRLKQLKNNLRINKSVTSAIYETGHGSSSRVYEKLNQQVGMTPRDYQKQGAGIVMAYADAPTPLGKMLLAATERGICFIQFGKTKAEMLATLADEFPRAQLIPMPRESRTQFAQWMKALNEYLKGSTHSIDLPLDIMGTAFQLKVWKFLQEIPRGTTVTYSDLAAKISQPRAVRAVASACARNNLAIIIPCHRVLRGSGELAGYRWGLKNKEILLKLEGAI